MNLIKFGDSARLQAAMYPAPAIMLCRAFSYFTLLNFDLIFSLNSIKQPCLFQLSLAAWTAIQAREQPAGGGSISALSCHQANALNPRSALKWTATVILLLHLLVLSGFPLLELQCSFEVQAGARTQGKGLHRCLGSPNEPCPARMHSGDFPEVCCFLQACERSWKMGSRKAITLTSSETSG